MCKAVEAINMSGKIYKHNPMVRGHFLVKDSDETVLPSEAGIDLLNLFYYHIQQSLWNITEDTIEEEHFVHHFRFSEVKRELGLTQKDFKKDIITAIESLYQADLILKNFKTHDGTVHGFFRTRIIAHYAIDIDGDIDRFGIRLNPMFTVMSARHAENFTLIDRGEVRMIKSKFAKRLHEYLKSRKQHAKKFSMDLEEANRILGRSDADMRKIVDIVKRSYDDLIQYTPFSYEYDRKSKSIVFEFGIVNSSL